MYRLYYVSHAHPCLQPSAMFPRRPRSVETVMAKRVVRITIRNGLLATLPPDIRASPLPKLETVRFHPRQALFRPETASDAVYFPETGCPWWRRWMMGRMAKSDASDGRGGDHLSPNRQDHHPGSDRPGVGGVRLLRHGRRAVQTTARLNNP
jgi:hypothetical protein